VICDGIWVGEDSSVPNVNGIRQRLVEETRKIKAPVVRHPGGCFADSYDWRDGVGPVDQRPLPHQSPRARRRPNPRPKTTNSNRLVYASPTPT